MNSVPEFGLLNVPTLVVPVHGPGTVKVNPFSPNAKPSKLGSLIGTRRPGVNWSSNPSNSDCTDPPAIVKSIPSDCPRFGLPLVTPMRARAIWAVRHPSNGAPLLDHCIAAGRQANYGRAASAFSLAADPRRQGINTLLQRVGQQLTTDPGRSIREHHIGSQNARLGRRERIEHTNARRAGVIDVCPPSI